MLYVELKQARAQLLELLELALQGEEVILTQQSQPVVMLVPVPTAPAENEVEGDQNPRSIEEDSEPDLDPGPPDEGDPFPAADDSIR